MAATELKKRLLLIIALIVFVVAKVPHLHDGFFWDESWVYAPSIFLMYAHGPSLLPNAIPVDYSRGHPLFFQAACAGWMHLFGKSNFSMHCFALFVSLATAVAVFEVCLRLFNQRTASVAIALLLLDVVFFVNSSFVMTDIMIGLFAFLSVYFYATNKYILTVLSATLLLFTKESGIVLPAVLFADIVITIVKQRKFTKEVWYKCMSVGLPLVFMLSFFLIQKQTFGWYLFPNHTDNIHLGADNTFYHLQTSLAMLFQREGLFYYYILLGLLLLLAAVQRKKPYYLLIIAYGVLLYLSALVFSHKDAVTYVFAGVSLVLLGLLYSKQFPALNDRQTRFMRISVAFSVAFIYFCCINFFETRYLLPAMLFITVMLAIGIDHFYPVRVKRLFLLPVLVLIGLNNFRMKSEEMLVYERMDVQQHLVDYFEKNSFYDKIIYARPFLEMVHLQDPKTGFLHSERTFTHVTDHAEHSTELVVMDSIEPDGQDDAIRKDSSFTLIHRYEQGSTWVEVYQRKLQPAAM